MHHRTTHACINSLHACRSAALLTYGFVAACALGVCLAGALHYEVGTGVNVGIGLGLGALIFGGAAIAAFFTRSDKDMSFKQWLGVWGFAGTRNLRTTFQVRTVRAGQAEIIPAEAEHRAQSTARVHAAEVVSDTSGSGWRGCLRAGECESDGPADPCAIV